MNGPERHARNENALGSHGEIRRRDRKAMRLNGKKIIGEKPVENRAVAEAHPNPQTARFGPAGESPVIEVGQRLVEILNKTKDFYLLVGKRKDVAIAAEHFDADGSLKRLGVNEAVNMIAFKAQDANTFIRRTAHGLRLPLSNIFRLIVSLAEWPLRVR